MKTPDDAWIALEHHPGDGPVVVLCHGISSNHWFWDLDESHSLARFLAAKGYDVWNLDLRGHGHAEKGPDGKRQRPQWVVDDYGVHDLPAAFGHVLAKSGKRELHFVGHSMGGMVLAVYLATEGRGPVRSAVAVGSPLDFRDPDVLTKLMLGGAPLAKSLGRLPTPMAAKLLGAAGRASVGQTDAILHNPGNMARDVELRMLRTVVSPLTKGEMEQFGRMRKDGTFRSMDGLDYAAKLGSVELPMLFFAVRADRIVAPDRVRAYYDSIGGDDKEFVVASEANGMHADYGHLDLGLGDHVVDDIFVPIAAFLERTR